MPRFYVQNKEGLWNIFSTIVDDFVYEEFMTFVIFKEHVIKKTIEEREKELDTLLSERPELNVMDYEEAIEIIKSVHSKEEDLL